MSAASSSTDSDAVHRHTAARISRTRTWGKDISKLVIVIGTGISVAAADPPAGLNVFSWPGLLKAGLDRVKLLFGTDSIIVETLSAHQADLSKSRPSAKDFANAGDFIRETLGDMEFQKWIKECFEHIKPKAGQTILPLIHALHARGAKLVTTNYDNLLKDSAPQGSTFNVWKRGVEGDANEWLRSNPLNADDRGVFHLHGHWSKTKNAVFSTTDYSKVVLMDKEVQKLMRSWGNSTVIFVGCGATPTDFNFSSLLKEMAKMYENEGTFDSSALSYFWAVREQEVAEKEALKIPLVTVVSYGKAHEDLSNFLEQILDANAKDSADNAYKAWQDARNAKADAQKEIFFHIFCHSKLQQGISMQHLQAITPSIGQIEKSSYDDKTFFSLSEPDRKVYYRLYSVPKGADAKVAAEAATAELRAKAGKLTLRKNEAYAVAVFQHQAHYYAIVECESQVSARKLLHQFVYTGFRVLCMEENLAPAAANDKDVLLIGFWCFPQHLHKPISELQGRDEPHANVVATVKLEPKHKVVMQRHVAPAIFGLMYHWGLRIEDDWDVTVEQLMSISEAHGAAIITQVNEMYQVDDENSEASHQNDNDGDLDKESVQMSDIASSSEYPGDGSSLPAPEQCEDFDVCLSGPPEALTHFQDAAVRNQLHASLGLGEDQVLHVGVIKCPRFPRCRADLVTIFEPRGQGSQHKCNGCSKFIKIGNAMK